MTRRRRSIRGIPIKRRPSKLSLCPLGTTSSTQCTARVSSKAFRFDRNVRYWPKADIGECTAHVRFWGQSRHGLLLNSAFAGAKYFCTAAKSQSINPSASAKANPSFIDPGRKPSAAARRICNAICVSEKFPHGTMTPHERFAPSTSGGDHASIFCAFCGFCSGRCDACFRRGGGFLFQSLP